MNFLTKFYQAAQAELQVIDPNVKVEVTGGCTVDGGVRYTPLTLVLPALRKHHSWSEGESFPCTNDPVRVCDFLLENWDSKGVIDASQVKVKVQSVPAPKVQTSTTYYEQTIHGTVYNPEGKKVRTVIAKDHWRVSLLIPCPPAVFPKDDHYRKQIATHLRRVRDVHHSTLKHDPRFELGEQLRSGGQVLEITYRTPNEVKYYRGSTLWYLGTVKNRSDVDAHLVLRAGNRRRYVPTVGRCLYAVKWCLFADLNDPSELSTDPIDF